MEEQKFSFSESFDKTKEYVETQVELLKLKAIARSSRIFGSLVLDASKVLLGLLIVFFMSLALGFYLGELLGSYSLGFIATAGIFILILLIIRAFEPKLEEKFMNFSIKRILSKWDEGDDNHNFENISQKVEEEIKSDINKREEEENERV